jgi:two-component system sensor histidine kinase/response regulator
MDVQMPEMNSLEAAARIRDHEAGGGRRVPIVALTANATAEDRVACLAAGMDDVLTKPISAARLQATLRRIAGEPQGAR